MFHFTPFCSLPTMNSSGSSLSGGLPHSEIHGSKPVCGSPWLIAANHVLHRLLAPRYSPPALSSLVKLSLSLSLSNFIVFELIVFELYCSLSLAFVSFVLGVLPRVPFPVRLGSVKNQSVQEQEHVLYPFSSSIHATFKEQPQIWTSPRHEHPLCSLVEGVVGLTGFEPVTLRLSSACSNQLSYKPEIFPVTEFSIRPPAFLPFLRRVSQSLPTPVRWWS